MVLAPVLAALPLSYELAKLFVAWPETSDILSAGSVGETSSEALAFSFREQPADVPDIRFVDADNQPRILSAFAVGRSSQPIPLFTGGSAAGLSRRRPVATGR